MDRGYSSTDLSSDNFILGRDRRRTPRHRVHTPAYANLSGSAQGAALELCEILNISASGMCIQSASPMKVNRLLPVSLEFSETHARIHVVGHVVWFDPSGKTGIRFPDLSEASQHQLHQWMEINAKAEAEQEAKPPISLESQAVQSKPTSASAYTSLVNEWAEIENEVELCGPDLDHALHLIAQRALTLTWASGTAIALINKVRQSEMICRARAGTDSPELGAPLEAGAGFSGECVRTGTAITCDDTEYDPRVDRNSCRALGIRSIAACPVKRNQEIIGIVEVFSPEPAAFWENDITILEKLANIITNAIRRAEHVGADVLSLPINTPAKSDSLPEASLNEQDTFSPSSSLPRKTVFLVLGMVLVALLVWVVASSLTNVGRGNPTLAAPSPTPSSSSDQTYVSSNSDDLKTLAMRGDVGAAYWLGVRYATGEGVKQDYHAAFEWFLRAAEQGDIRAQAKVAAWFWAGRGMPQDYSKAYFWGLLAQAGGDETGRTIVLSSAPYLTSQQIALEHTEADNWLHAHHIAPSTSGSPR